MVTAKPLSQNRGKLPLACFLGHGADCILTRLSVDLLMGRSNNFTSWFTLLLVPSALANQRGDKQSSGSSVSRFCYISTNLGCRLEFYCWSPSSSFLYASCRSREVRRV
ncbi:hypothetical protein NEOLEDRAFT_857562 [Neolentinus lepideus HHB14362 ss-1]|uniref:Uncharacterized protein n=1 Tax=Neolentinus lepideus HHB14362 ss-1 TaxID=1314782 RepID=A0A165UR45_9AGAM|nr:hypothetical protein NEOLEDRAFT_857562 [Neolentinus lepideus HHB14362 ss-1]